MEDSGEIRTFAPGMLKCGHENMKPEEYIEKLKEAQSILDSVKEDLDRAIDKMQRRIDAGDEGMEQASHLAALVGREYVKLADNCICDALKIEY